jgi:hypothetical protein
MLKLMPPSCLRDMVKEARESLARSFTDSSIEVRYRYGTPTNIILRETNPELKSLPLCKILRAMQQFCDYGSVNIYFGPSVKKVRSKSLKILKY